MTRYQRASINTADDVRAVAQNAGSHFFDTDTMRFFSSRLLSGVVALDGRETQDGRRYLFVTSERNMFTDQPRQYTARMLTLLSTSHGFPAVEIDALGNVRAFTTARQARTFARSLVGLPECGLANYGSACRQPAWREIWHGANTPARACGFHADTFTREVIAAHH
jgi:hypothetical protein